MEAEDFGVRYSKEKITSYSEFVERGVQLYPDVERLMEGGRVAEVTATALERTKIVKAWELVKKHCGPDEAKASKAAKFISKLNSALLTLERLRARSNCFKLFWFVFGVSPKRRHPNTPEEFVSLLRKIFVNAGARMQYLHFQYLSRDLLKALQVASLCSNASLKKKALLLRGARPHRNYLMFCEGKWCLCNLCFRLFDNVDALAMHQRDFHPNLQYVKLEPMNVAAN